MTIDLHTHSSCSDGTDPPARLVRHAAAAGITVLGLTDHDTTAGWVEAIAALPAGMTLVPGIELSARCDLGSARTAVHILGYLPDPGDAALRDALAELRASRLRRAETIVGRLAADGVPIDWQQVATLAAGATVGRPHIARALIDSGVVDSVGAAFAGPLNARSPYYQPKADLPASEAIRLVRAAGGVAALAHPLARRRGLVVDDADIVALAGAGLAGIEVDHPDHDEADRRHLAALAERLDLIALGSSDYHGTNKTTGLAACTTASASYRALVELAGHPVVLG